MHTYEVLRRPLVSEKTNLLLGANKYVFEVANDANKAQVKEAVELAFKVTVTAVNIVSLHGEVRRVGRHRVTTPDRKKAIVTLKTGDKIELFEGA